MQSLTGSPQQRYTALIDAGRLCNDPAQQGALNALETLCQHLLQRRSRRHHCQGLYLWGSVGRGKTLLMDLFVASLPPSVCLRQHFHHFMAAVYQQLRAFSGQPDPLQHIARALSRQTQVLCFDEFFVTDIGDAMLLGNLLQALFSHGVILVATSNTPPDRLYWNGLQRERFLPAINAIQAHTRSLHLDGLQDHRERAFDQVTGYFVETEEVPARQALRQQLLSAAGLPASVEKDGVCLSILGRSIPCIAKQARTLCVAFEAVCEGPRSHFDYVEIARQFDTVLLFGLPRLSGVSCERIKARGTEDGALGSGLTGERQVILAPKDDAARRFIALIDEFYERRVKLVLTSAVALDEVYTQGSLTFEFQRARSRLLEMRSHHQQAI